MLGLVGDVKTCFKCGPKQNISYVYRNEYIEEINQMFKLILKSKLLVKSVLSKA